MESPRSNRPAHSSAHLHQHQYVSQRSPRFVENDTMGSHRGGKGTPPCDANLSPRRGPGASSEHMREDASVISLLSSPGSVTHYIPQRSAKQRNVHHGDTSIRDNHSSTRKMAWSRSSVQSDSAPLQLSLSMSARRGLSAFAPETIPQEEVYVQQSTAAESELLSPSPHLSESTKYTSAGQRDPAAMPTSSSMSAIQVPSSKRVQNDVSPIVPNQYNAEYAHNPRSLRAVSSHVAQQDPSQLQRALEDIEDSEDEYHDEHDYDSSYSVSHRSQPAFASPQHAFPSNNRALDRVYPRDSSASQSSHNLRHSVRSSQTPLSPYGAEEGSLGDSVLSESIHSNRPRYFTHYSEDTVAGPGTGTRLRLDSAAAAAATESPTPPPRGLSNPVLELHQPRANVAMQLLRQETPHDI